MITSKNSTVLVTGGAGFLGSFLCEELLKHNNRVICVDNLSTGTLNNIQHLLENKKFKIVSHDVCEPFFFRVNEIYHLACPASPKHYQLNPIKTLETCFLGSSNVLALAKKLNIKVLFASTSEIYGDPKEHPQLESYNGNVNTIGIRSCYDEGKRCAESLFFNYLRQHNIDVKIVRIFNTYGPRMKTDDGRVISNFIVQALNNEPITIHGNGLQTRSFCYVDDLVRGLINMMKTKHSGPINLGNTAEINMIDLANIIIDKVNSCSKICFNSLPEDDPKQRKPNIELAKRLINWKPIYSLDHGLTKTIDYFSRKITNTLAS